MGRRRGISPYSKSLRLEPLEQRRLLSAGDLDSTFGSGGIVTTDFLQLGNDYAKDVMVQPDGKTVVVGEMNTGASTAFAVVRYKMDGSLDDEFGQGGIVTADFGFGRSSAESVALQTDGKIVVAGVSNTVGTTYQDFAVARFNSDGSPDASFGMDGLVTTDFASGGSYSADQAYGVSVQQDGKIIVVGKRYDSTTGTKNDTVLVRYATDGSLDPAFGVGGKVVTDFDSANGDFARDVVLQSDGKIAITGQKGYAENFFVARYEVNGNLDTTFGSGGSVSTSFSSGNDYGNALALQSNGKIVVAGLTWTGSSYDATVARYTSQGTLDTSFGNSGRTFVDLGTTYDYFYDLTIQADNKIIAVGRPQVDPQSDPASSMEDFAVVRLTENGAVDNTFGNGGKVLSDFFGGRDEAYAVAIDSSGRVYVAGPVHTGVDYDFALARYTTSGTLDTTFGNSGSVATNIANGFEAVEDIAQQPDGKIVAVGRVVSGGVSDSGLARYSLDGSLDASFGTDGRLLVSLPYDYVYLWAIAVQTDGKILVAGQFYRSGTSYDFGVARYQTDGALDTTFGNAGVALVDYSGGYDQARDLAVQADGLIVVAGAAGGSTPDFGLIRLRENGTLDTSFGSSGKVQTDFNGEANHIEAIAIQPDGKIVASGRNSYQSQYDMALARYNADGSLDASFGSGGKRTVDLAYMDVANAIALQPDGKIVVAGRTGEGSNGPFDFAVARFNSNGYTGYEF